MKRTRFLLHIFLGYLILFANSEYIQAQNRPSQVVANPIDLNYRFQPGGNSYREAADPVLEYYKGKYYLFASKSGGYWSSSNLFEWNYIPCKTIETIEAYAPTIMEYEGYLYFLASGGEPRIFRTTNPDIDAWEEIDTKFSYGNTDPAFFPDDDGKVYLYWGCSDKDPIVGVEVDPQDGFRALSVPDTLITHQYQRYGWEAPGENNDKDENGWNEGPCMIKHNGKYYLQYAAPGTQFRTYADGIYVADNPLGAFTYVENSPFSFKPGGFIGGAGHGHTFKDKHGNYWHVASMKISIRHMFERRLGIFPVYLTDEGLHQHSVFTDYPFTIPDRKVNFQTDSRSLNWNLLSYRKPVSSSSDLPGYETAKVNDEAVETWWAAQTGNMGEWWQIDLCKPMTVEAIQINFADHQFPNTPEDSYINYQYQVEHSSNGKQWLPLIDRTKNRKDAPHELIVLDNPVQTRYLRITNTKQMPGNFSMYGFRVFGKGNGSLPTEVKNISIIRNKEDRRMITFKWKENKKATGYIIRWGIKKEAMTNALMVYDTECIYRFFNKDSEYYFSVDTFNENGITQGKNVYHIN